MDVSPDDFDVVQLPCASDEFIYQVTHKQSGREYNFAVCSTCRGVLGDADVQREVNYQTVKAMQYLMRVVRR